MSRKCITAICRRLYDRNVAGAGFGHPDTLMDIERIILASGASVYHCADAPDDFLGVQIGSVVYLNAAAKIPEWRHIRICAHEWCHFLRRRECEDAPVVSLYSDNGDSNGTEELIAIEFENMFDIRFQHSSS